MKLMNVGQAPVAKTQVNHANVAKANKQAAPAVTKQCCTPEKAGKALNVKG